MKHRGAINMYLFADYIWQHAFFILEDPFMPAAIIAFLISSTCIANS